MPSRIPRRGIEGFLRQFCPMRDGDFNDDAARHELGLRQDLLHGLGEHLARDRINRWLSWRDWQAFFGDQAHPLTAHKMHARLGVPGHTGTDLGQVRDVRVVTSIFNDAATPFVWRIGTGVEHKCNVLAYREADSGLAQVSLVDERQERSARGRRGTGSRGVARTQ